MKPKNYLRASFTSFLLLVVFTVFSQNDTLRLSHWKEDIKWYQSGLEQKHMNVYHKISKEAFSREVQEVVASIPDKTDLELTVDLMRLTRKIGDGHTSISTRNLSKHLFPFDLRYISNGWRVVRVVKGYENLLGLTLTKVDGTRIEDAMDELSGVSQYVENEHSQLSRNADYFPISELLNTLQITRKISEASFTFSDDSGKETTQNLKSIPSDTYYRNTEFVSITPVVPEIEKPQQPTYDFLWFAPIQNTQGLYIKFESYPQVDGMQAFGQLVSNYINAHKVKQLVIDLRNNNGGDFFVGVFLAYFLNLCDGLDWNHGIYLLIDNVTFSAATINAAMFRDILNPKVVGIPTGSNPTGYQDMSEFTLPHSQLVVTYSKRLFRFQEEATPGIQPDVKIDYDWKNYANGHDNILQWVIDDIKKN